MAVNPGSLARLAAILALFGTRTPEAPIVPDVVEGPFEWGVATITTAASATYSADFIGGSTPLFLQDKKLRQYAQVSASSRPVGVLYINAIGGDVAAGSCTDVTLMGAFLAFGVRHTPSGASRDRIIALNTFGRTFAGQTVVSGAMAGQPTLPLYRTPGGPWKVNFQADTLVLENLQASTGPTLANSIYVSGRVDGCYVVQGTSTELGLLGADISCDTSKIPAILASRSALRMASHGGGML